MLYLYRALTFGKMTERVPHCKCFEKKRRMQGRQMLEAPSLHPTATALWADVRRAQEPTVDEALQQLSCNVDVELASIVRFVSNKKLERCVSGSGKASPV